MISDSTPHILGRENREKGGKKSGEEEGRRKREERKRREEGREEKGEEDSFCNYYQMLDHTCNPEKPSRVS